MKKAVTLALAGALAVSVGLAQAHGDENHAGKPRATPTAEQTPFGIAGDPKRATRTMTIAMNDRMHFVPDMLSVRQGETVRFVVVNQGRLLHELVIGTPSDLASHAELMRQFPDMEHDEPHMVHVQPGKSGEIVWTFNRTGLFQFACLVGGHYEAGMKGTIFVKREGDKETP